MTPQCSTQARGAGLARTRRLTKALLAHDRLDTRVDATHAGRAPAGRVRARPRLPHWLGISLLVAGVAATSAAGASPPISAGLGTAPPPKPSLSVSGDGGGEGGENGSAGTAETATLAAPAAWVSRLQTKLARLGYFSGPVTGVFGPLTTAAVKRFQAANNLTPDGLWGPASQAILAAGPGLGTTTVNAATSPSPSSSALPPPAAWVSRLQTKLGRLGYFSGPVTGVYGPLTTAAVKRFQAASSLTPDGRWGPASQAALTTRLATRG